MAMNWRYRVELDNKEKPELVLFDSNKSAFDASTYDCIYILAHGDQENLFVANARNNEDPPVNFITMGQIAERFKYSLTNFSQIRVKLYFCDNSRELAMERARLFEEACRSLKILISAVDYYECMISTPVELKKYNELT